MTGENEYDEAFDYNEENNDLRGRGANQNEAVGGGHNDEEEDDIEEEEDEDDDYGEAEGLANGGEDDEGG